MSSADQEPDPRRRVPAVLWLMIAVLVVVAFAALIAWRGGHVAPRSVGPPAGAPDSGG